MTLTKIQAKAEELRRAHEKQSTATEVIEFRTLAANTTPELVDALLLLLERDRVTSEALDDVRSELTTKRPDSRWCIDQINIQFATADKLLRDFEERHRE